MRFNAIRKRDPSSLKHYGVKGQKWGIRSDETLYRYGLLRGPGRKIKGSLVNVVDKNSRIRLNNTNFQNANPGTFPDKKHEYSRTNDMKAVNPYMTALNVEATIKPFFTKNSWLGNEKAEVYRDVMENGKFSGAHVNCASCSVVYDLRRRGFDVSATMGESVSSGSLMKQCYPNASWSKVMACDALQRSIRNETEPGARGIVTYDYSGTNVGHAIAFEVDEDGEPHYYDCQTGEESTGLPFIGIENFQYMRLDDQEPDLTFINERGLCMPTPHSEPEKADKQTSILNYMHDKIKGASDAYKEVENLKNRFRN